MPFLCARHPLHRPAAVFLLLAALSLAETAAGQGPVFQTINTVPRSRGLGEAAVALRGYAGADQLNPAAIGMAGTVQATTTFDPEGGFALRIPWLRRSLFARSGGERAMWMVAPSLDVRRGRWALAAVPAPLV